MGASKSTNTNSDDPDLHVAQIGATTYVKLADYEAYKRYQAEAQPTVQHAGCQTEHVLRQDQGVQVDMPQLSDSPLTHDQETQVNLLIEEEAQAAAKEAAWDAKAWDEEAGDAEAWDEAARDDKAWDEEAGDAKAWDKEAGDEVAAEQEAGDEEAKGTEAKRDSSEATPVIEGSPAQQTVVVDASVNVTVPEVTQKHPLYHSNELHAAWSAGATVWHI